MTLAGWILEYCKVFIAYMLLMFAWPSLLFGSFLKKKTWKYRLGFCPVFSLILINTVVLLLGLVHALNPIVVRILFYGSVIVTIFIKIPDKHGMVERGLRLVAGSYGFKQLMRNMSVNTRKNISTFFSSLWKRFLEHKIEYILLLAILIYGTVYFSYGSIQINSYGFGDMYTHHSWIYGLIKGQIFSAGIYPEGMHCFIYAMHVLFGIKVFSCMQFTAGVHILLTLLSAYVFFREVFRSKYTPILALTVFLTIDAMCIDGVYAMSRFQWTIPQEFGFFTIFICAAALIRYINTEKEKFPKLIKIKRPAYYVETESKLIYNDELLVFGGAIAASVIIHFYVTGIAFFLCVAIVPFAIHKIFNPKRFAPLFLSILISVVVAIAPMGLAYASGIELQGSIGWAVNVINGEAGQFSSGGGDTEEDTEDEEAGAGTLDDENANAGAGTVTDTESVVSANVGSQNGEETTGEISASEKQAENSLSLKKIVETIKEKAVGVYNYGYVTIYRQERAKKIIWLILIALCLFASGKIGNIIYVSVTKEKEVGVSLFDGYFVLVFSSVIFMIMYSAPNIGIPELIAYGRLVGIEQFLLCAVVVIPIDMILWIIEHYISDIPQGIIATAGTFGIFAATILTGTYHGYLYMEYTRLNSAVDVTESIISTIDKNSFTIVSPVDELYQVAEYGYHEELVEFINECVEKDYTLPTKYVFIFYEKRPIKYAQYQFFTGPSWLAQEKYLDFYGDYARRYPQIISAVAGNDIATGVFYKYPVASSSYSDWMTRLVLESRMLLWVEDFNKLYPTELHVYYDDDYFTCYYFEQNPSCLYQLGFEKGDSTEDGN